MLFDPSSIVEVRVLGPNGKPFVDLENKYIKLFQEYDINYNVPRLFSAPEKTTVVITIGIAVIASLASHLVIKFVDEVFSINDSQPNTEITINIHNGNEYILIEGNKTEIINQLNTFNVEIEK